MSDVLISAQGQDRALALALQARLEAKGINAAVAAPGALYAEATSRKKSAERKAGPLSRAKAVISVQSARTARDAAVTATARSAVANGARLIQALAKPKPTATAFPNAPAADLSDWDRQSEDHAGLQAILAFVDAKLTPAPATPRAAGAPRKRLVILCDGTWQSLRNLRRTNVAYAATAVQRSDQNGIPQITYYDDGVGALARGLQSVVQGVTGVGLDDRILAAYRFLTLNYELGDEIFLFGFSRGAYTVRSLGGLIRTCGILRREYAHREAEAMELYRQRETKDIFGNVEQIDNRDYPEAQAFRQNFARAWVNPAAPPIAPGQPIRPDQLTVAFMGVWDTVGSLGVPPTLWFKGAKYQFHDLSLGAWVQQARHAVALDERRNAFGPSLWDNAVGMTPPAGTKSHPTALQMWFAGDHGGVGGGDDREGLSNQALLWILEGARDAGLSLKGSILDEFAQAIETLNTPVRRMRLGSLPTYLRGWRDRPGPARLDDVHPSAVARLEDGKPRYRPGALKPLKDTIQLQTGPRKRVSVTAEG